MQQIKRWPSRSSKSLFHHTTAILAFALLALVALPALAATPPLKPGLVSADALTLHDGVVVDSASGNLYVMNPAGGIDAVALSGEILWHSDAAAKPLAVAGGKLVAQANAGAQAGELRVVALDIRSGSASFSSTIALPADVHGTVVDGLGKSFRVGAAAQGSDLLLTWKSTETPRQGYLPAETEQLTPTLANKARSNEGAVRLDLGSGAVAPVTKAAMAMPASLRQLEQPLKGLAGRQFLSLDGRHVLGTRPLVNEGRMVHLWTIYDRASGEHVGSVERPAGASPFFVSGQTLVHVTQPMIHRQGEDWVDQPLMVRALDLTTGLELWSKEAEDTSFRGPFPP